MRSSKKVSQRIHAKRRCWSRYGLELTSRQIKEIVRQVQEQDDAVFITRHSNTRTIWRVNYSGKRLIVVYDNKRQNIATFLPPRKRYLGDQPESESATEPKRLLA